MKKNKYEIDMCNGTIMDKLISFSLPLMLTSILQLMFNAWIFCVGRFTGSQAWGCRIHHCADQYFYKLFIGFPLAPMCWRPGITSRTGKGNYAVHTEITLALISGHGFCRICVFQRPCL